MSPRRRGLALALLLAGCAEDAHDDAPVSAFAIALGQGVDAFTPLDDGDTLLLERGTQGYQHVYIAVRAAIPPGFHPVAVSLVDASGDNAASPYRVGVPFTAVDEPWSEVVGLQVVIPEPSSVLAAPANLTVTVTAPDATEAWDARPVIIAW